jgi:hypothetical protein
MLLVSSTNNSLEVGNLLLILQIIIRPEMYKYECQLGGNKTLKTNYGGNQPPLYLLPILLQAARRRQ